MQYCWPTVAVLVHHENDKKNTILSQLCRLSLAWWLLQEASLFFNKHEEVWLVQAFQYSETPQKLGPTGKRTECNNDENNASRITEISSLLLLLLFHQRPLFYNFFFRTRFQNL